MKYIDVIVPTRNRIDKLLRMIKTVPPEILGIKILTTVICDGDKNTALEIIGSGKADRVIFHRKKIGSVASRNIAIQAAEDAVVTATDDIIFQTDAFKNAILSMQSHFPDDDGVIGFNQINHKSFSPAGVVLVGQPFLRRYPNRKLYCPEYFHFACQEIDRLGRKLGKIHLEETAQLKHFHPDMMRDEMDKTHKEARERRDQDLSLSRQRKIEGKIWGDKEYHEGGLP